MASSRRTCSDCMFTIFTTYMFIIFTTLVQWPKVGFGLRHMNVAHTLPLASWRYGAVTAGVTPAISISVCVCGIPRYTLNTAILYYSQQVDQPTKMLGLVLSHDAGFSNYLLDSLVLLHLPATIVLLERASNFPSCIIILHSHFAGKSTIVSVYRVLVHKSKKLGD